MSDLEYVSPATTSYKDWTGTAAAESSMLSESGDLYELAGLDHGRWSIMAIDISAFSHGKEPDWDVEVFAFDREANGVGSHDDLLRLASEEGRGSVPVVSIRLHGVSLTDVVKCMKVVHFQLTTPKFPTMDIVERTDFPVQE